MPEYLSPGVYVEEIDAGPKPIEGVSTSTAGAVGITSRGPTTGKPELVTSFTEFTRIFGGLVSEPADASLVNKWALDSKEGGRWWYFPLSVKGFFDNGGQRLYVKRVFSAHAQAAGVTLGQGVDIGLTDDAASTDSTLSLSHLLGIQVGTTLTIFAGGTVIPANPVPAPPAPPWRVFTVTHYDADERTITLDQTVGQQLKAGRDFVNIVARVTAAPGPPDTRTLTFRAKALGDWGNGLSVRVTPMVGSTLKILPDPVTGGAAAKTALTAMVAQAHTVLSAPANGQAATIQVQSTAGFAANDHVTIDGHPYQVTAIAAGPPPTLTITPVVPGQATDVTWHPGMLVQRLREAANSSTVLPVAATAGFAANDKVFINGGEYDVTAVAAGPPATITITPGVPDLETWGAGAQVVRMRPANTANASTKIHLAGVASLYDGALVEVDNGTNKEIRSVHGINGAEVTFAGANLAHAYFEGQKARVIEASVSVSYQPGDVVEAQESFTNLRLVSDGSLSYLPTNVNLGSNLVQVVVEGGLSAGTFSAFPSVGPPTAPDPTTLWTDLVNGNDSHDTLTVDDFVGVDAGSGHRTGIQALEDIEEISLCMAPQMWSESIHGALIEHCESLRYRFGIIDPEDGLSLQAVRDMRDAIDTKYAALYYPWIEVRDPSIHRNVIVAPSGHMAGLYARVDVDRGYYKAPANEVIQGITKIAQDVTKREQDMLNPKGINALRFFPGRGNRVWGARTLSSDSSWKYVNVRRIFIFVEASIDAGTQWVVFEPNDEPLWARVRQTITNFLTSVWRSGALQGAKPDEAFFVKCDHTTMSQDDIDNGRLICLIGIAPVKPAEFVIFRIQQKTNTSVS
jgi:phage tail sheath protein FI